MSWKAERERQQEIAKSQERERAALVADPNKNKFRWAFGLRLGGWVVLGYQEDNPHGQWWHCGWECSVDDSVEEWGPWVTLGGEEP